MKLLKIILPYFYAPFLTFLIFSFLFKIWNIDFHSPAFGYTYESLFNLFYVKNIIDSGWIFTNSYVGAPHFTEPFSNYDFPIQSDIFNIVILKIFSLFIRDHFAITNYFFVLTFALISFSSFLVLRQFKISIFTSVIISVIYAFLPYHFSRGVFHLFLSNYMAVPLSIMVGLWIISDKINIFYKDERRRYSIRLNSYFVTAFLITIFIATNGVYYAYYSCVIFIFSLFLRSLKNGVFIEKNNLEPVALCLVIFLVLLYLYLPTFFYHLDHKPNAMVGGRTPMQSEHYALRLIDLFIPADAHFVASFSKIREFFNIAVGAELERISVSLGIVGSAGFIFLLVWLISKNFNEENSFLNQSIKKLSLSKNDQNLISSLSCLSLLSLLFASAGGLVMFVSLLMPSIRSHARFCTFIAFLSLFLVAIVFDKIINKKFFGKKIYIQVVLLVIMIFAVLDQSGTRLIEYTKNRSFSAKFDNDRDFIAKIENSMPPKSMIFILPISRFPEGTFYESLVAYINSKNLRWSYPAVFNRESDIWQNKVFALGFKKFITEIKKVGFSGIYIDRKQYFEKNKLKELAKIENMLRSQAKYPAIISRDKKLIFFKI